MVQDMICPACGDKPQWISEFARRRVCNYVWVAVTPTDGELSNLECPNCHTTAGELIGESDDMSSL